MHPNAAERRHTERRVRDEERTDDTERRKGRERRKPITPVYHAPLAAEFKYGWLCFQTADEKRRLAPIPEAWEQADDETIEQWCCLAKGVPRRKSDSARAGDGDQKLP